MEVISYVSTFRNFCFCQHKLSFHILVVSLIMIHFMSVQIRRINKSFRSHNSSQNVEFLFLKRKQNPASIALKIEKSYVCQQDFFFFVSMVGKILYIHKNHFYFLANKIQLKLNKLVLNLLNKLTFSVCNCIIPTIFILIYY